VKADAQYDELHWLINHRYWRRLLWFAKSRKKRCFLGRGYTRVAIVSKNKSIQSAVLIQYWHVTDRQLDTANIILCVYIAYASHCN